jgi:Tfp pilus assembly PilM family ATPase
MGGFAASSALAQAGGHAVALFVFAESTSLAAFQDSRLVFYREHAVGMDHLRDAISSQVGIEPELVDSVLEDTLIDPVPVIEPILRPLYRQIEISADYLLRRCKCQVEHFFVNGLTVGGAHWATLFKSVMNQTMTFCSPFDGIGRTGQATRLPEDVEKRAPLLMTALGAARTVLEDV